MCVPAHIRRLVKKIQTHVVEAGLRRQRSVDSRTAAHVQHAAVS